MDSNTLVHELKALYPHELLTRYANGERDFHGINLLRAELEQLAPSIKPYQTIPQSGVPFGHWGGQVSPLWVDRRTSWEPLFHWESDAFDPLLEESWEDQDDWQDVAIKDLARADLADINLQGAYLYRINLSNARLSHAKLQAAILVEVDLSGATLDRVDLREARAVGVNLAHANLYLARLERADLSAADLSHANLSRARLRRARLPYTKWRGATLKNARFSRNNLIGSDFRGLDFKGIRLSDAAVYGSIIMPKQGSDFLDALAIVRDPSAIHPHHVYLPTP